MDRSVRIFLVIAAGVLLAHILDGWAFRELRVEGIYGEDWGRFLRVLGFLPVWLMAGLALILHDCERGRQLLRARGTLLFASATLGGIAAELLKLVFRRLRPGDLGDYAFRPFTERPFSTAGLGLPSSHALVAFGAAAMLSRLFPRARLVWWGLAWGCGLSRVAAGAHFLSDVVASAGVGWLVGAWVWRWHQSEPGGALLRQREHPVPLRATEPI